MAEEDDPTPKQWARSKCEPAATVDLHPKDPDERSTSRRKRANPEAAVNAIQATRKPRKTATHPSRPLPPPQRHRTHRLAARAAAASSRPAGLPRGDSDPWTVPESVRNRFVQDGHRFYFPDGAPAFKDQGRRLTTPSDNTQVVHSLIRDRAFAGMDRSHRYRNGAISPGGLAPGAPRWAQCSRLSRERGRTRSS